MSKLSCAKPWGGRFNLPTSRLVEEFTASIGFDVELYQDDIAGSIVHARMLARQGIISQEDSDRIVAGLEQVRTEIENGSFTYRVELEDIHMNVESRLAEIVGVDVAGRLHTGRSRNDQVALDIRLYLRRHLRIIKESLLRLMSVFVWQAEKNINVIMPGFTHLQQAQPVLFGHHMMAYYEMFKRDFARFDELCSRVEVSPLGSGALAGSSFPLDRQWVAEQLGLHGITANSLDAVGDRDMIVEFLANSSLLMVHLSRFCEELILWSTVQFGFVELAENFCTGSSIMPQKKNPDVPELIRGKCGRVFGHLISLLTTLKSLPLAYNKDLQEDKEPLFDVVRTVEHSLKIMCEMLSALIINSERMEAFAGSGFSTATEIADYLVRKGIPFRQAHTIVGRIVAYCENNGIEFSDLDLAQWRDFSDLFDETILERISVHDAVEAKDLPGGTATNQVVAQIRSARDFIKRSRERSAND